MKIKDLRGTVRELVLGVKGRKKDDVIQVLLRHASDCQLQGTVSGLAKKHKHIITKVCESHTFIRQLISAYVLELGIWYFNTSTLMFSINASVAFEPIFKRDKLASAT